ncbi:MAG: 7TM diverse intracellular signaling domain-containing protein [Thermonemataceae bacterium]|nr:7TM diverse intracellular signaling domain-containing protein [Thermonemataceae bacterium]
MKFLFAVIFYLISIPTIWAQIILNEEKNLKDVSKFLFVWEDKSGDATIEKVSSEIFQSNFKPLEQKNFNKGVSTSVYWLKIQVINQNLKNLDWILYSANGFLDEVALYQQNMENKWVERRLGLLYPYQDRPIKHRYLIFPLSFKSIEIHTFYLKISSTTPLQVPLYIERASYFSEPSRSEELFYGIFIGIITLMLVGSLFYWIYFRDKAYIYYSVFLLGATIFYLSISGHLFQYFWKDDALLGKTILGIGIGLWIIGAGLFTKTFLYTFRYFPLGGKLMDIYALLGIWTVLSVFFLPYRFFTIQIIVIGNIGNIIITIVGLICWFRQNPYARYFTVAWTAYVTGTILLALSVLGFIPRTFITAHLGEISSIFEVIMFALALSYKSRVKHERVRQDRLRSQQKVIELQKENNVRLERQIEERTQDLAQKQREIEVQNEELRQQREELEASHNQLFEQNKVIEQQNAELTKYNENLENIVEERTKQLSQANLTLVSQNIQLEQFAFITAHNLRSPVAQLIGLTGLFNKENFADPLNVEIFRYMVSSAQTMQRTLQDLNEILEVRKGRNQSLEKIPFEAISKEVISDYFANADARISFDFKDADSVIFIKAYLKSIFYNFISNAIKYKHQHRKAEILVFSTDFPNEIRLSFKDNGLGIDLKKYKHKLFGLYQRFHLEKEGKGMGLYLCKTQVEALGGRIEVQSELDKGTQFDIYFKKHQELG